MLKKALIIFMSILLLLPLLTGAVGFSQTVNNDPPSFQKPCDMDHCNPYMPKCPLCPSSSSHIPYLPNGARIYLPTLNSSFNLVSLESLSDQGFVKSIFHPPTSLL